MKQQISQDCLRSLIHYDQETGIFTWLPRKNNSSFNTKHAGSVAGCLIKTGKGYTYRFLKIMGESWKASHLAWVYVHGYDVPLIDHKNRNTLDDRIENLRPATKSGNSSNSITRNDNNSGHKGVCRKNNKWRVQICKDGKVIHLGYFHNLDDAKNTYISVAKSLHGEFARWFP